MPSATTCEVGSAVSGISDHGYVRTSLKCTAVERSAAASFVRAQGEVDPLQISDRYVEGSSWRFREMVWPRRTPGPRALVCHPLGVNEREES